MLKLNSLRQPLYFIVLLNILAIILLLFHKQPYDYQILFQGLLITIMICATYFILIKKNLGDEYLFLIVSMLTSIGYIMIYRLDPVLGLKQTIWFAIGIILFFLSYYTFSKVKVWDKLMFYYILSSIILFFITLAFGKNIKGSTNWIVFYGHSYQPSEIIKILFVLFFASFYRHSEQIILKDIKFTINPSQISSKLFLMVITFMYAGLFVLQNDWGTSLLLFLTYFALLYILDNNLKFLFNNLSIAVVGALVGFFYVYHIKVRIDAWLNPWADISGKGYQITQSLFAIGSGGFFGTGIGLGRPDFIPEVKNDFIFSAICEEMGIFVGVAVILLFFILSYRGFKIALTVKDTFQKTLALGITLIFGLQTFIIIGGVIKLIPLTGITLPFISYGGSSLTASFIALGILQAISNKSFIKEECKANAGK